MSRKQDTEPHRTATSSYYRGTNGLLAYQGLRHISGNFEVVFYPFDGEGIKAYY